MSDDKIRSAQQVQDEERLRHWLPDGAYARLMAKARTEPLIATLMANLRRCSRAEEAVYVMHFTVMYLSVIKDNLQSLVEAHARYLPFSPIVSLEGAAPQTERALIAAAIEWHALRDATRPSRVAAENVLAQAVEAVQREHRRMNAADTVPAVAGASLFRPASPVGFKPKGMA